MSRREKPDFREKVTYHDPHRLLPQSPDAEQGVLCSFLLNPQEVGGLCVEMGVEPHYFHIESNGVIYQKLIDRWDSGRKIDFITLTQDLRDNGTLDRVGGAAFVTELFTFLPTAANARYYLEILSEKFVLRKAITTCTEFACRAYDEQDNVPTLIDDLEREILGIRPMSEVKRISTKDDVMGAIEDIERLYEGRGTVSGLSTGFFELDKLTDGMHPEEMIVIAARPSMGKSSIALNIAEHVAVDCKIPVGIFSLEMSRKQLMQRLLCSRSRVNIQRVRDGHLSDKDFPNLTVAASKIAGSTIIIDDASSTSIQRLQAVGRRWKHEFKIGLIVIDYLQLLTSSSKRAQENRQLEVSEISAGIKRLSRELSIPILALAQIKRATSGYTKPRLDALRESGSIEQDADIVMFVDREEMNTDEEEVRNKVRGQADLIIAKNRSGPTDTVKLTFLKEYTRFENRATQSQEAKPPSQPKLAMPYLNEPEETD